MGGGGGSSTTRHRKPPERLGEGICGLGSTALKGVTSSVADNVICLFSPPYGRLGVGGQAVWYAMKNAVRLAITPRRRVGAEGSSRGRQRQVGGAGGILAPISWPWASSPLGEASSSTLSLLVGSRKPNVVPMFLFRCIITLKGARAGSVQTLETLIGPECAPNTPKPDQRGGPLLERARLRRPSRPGLTAGVTSMAPPSGPRR